MVAIAHLCVDSLRYEFDVLRLGDASGRRLHNDCSRHVWMQETKVVVGARRRECERVSAAGVEHLGAEVVGRHNHVRGVVLVGPSDRGPRFHRQFLRTEHEVSDLDGSIGRPDRCRRQE